jgi:lipopolysaccharide export system protein LptA
MAALILVAAHAVSRAEDSRPAGPGTGPVVITAETLQAESRTNSALFEGSVVATTDDMTLTADRMKVFYTSDGAIERMEAEGNVRLVRGSRVVTSRAALYEAALQRLVFTGSPRAVEGGSVVTGSRMTYLIAEDRSIVEDSKVFLEQGGARAPGDGAAPDEGVVPGEREP